MQPIVKSFHAFESSNLDAGNVRRINLLLLTFIRTYVAAALILLVGAGLTPLIGLQQVTITVGPAVRVAGINSRAAGEQRDRLSRTAVVAQRPQLAIGVVQIAGIGEVLLRLGQFLLHAIVPPLRHLRFGTCACKRLTASFPGINDDRDRSHPVAFDVAEVFGTFHAQSVEAWLRVNGLYVLDIQWEHRCAESGAECDKDTDWLR